MKKKNKPGNSQKLIADSLAKNLNTQLNRELQSAYLYFSMAAECKARSLDGFEHWMLLQAQEEIGHAMKIYRYLNDRNCRVVTLALNQPQTTFDSIQQIFEMALKNEEDLDHKLNALATESFELQDNTTYQFLKWFLDEQVEEIATCVTILDKLKLIDDNGYGLLMLNDELGKRKAEEDDGGMELGA